MAIDYSKIPSPCFVLDEVRLRTNLELIQRIKEESGAEIILAFKGFAMWSAFSVLRAYISGAAASSLNEAKLCAEEMETKAHTYAVAYAEDEFDEIASLSSHITFNSIGQYERFKGSAKNVSFGLRVNPEWSDVATELYNPASSISRLGITSDNFPNQLPEGIEGLHLHVLCESDSFALEKVLKSLEERFGKHLDRLKWINMGGGHLITRNDYDVDHLVQVLKDFQDRHNVKVILEPGAAFVWQTGELVTSVLDIVENGGVKTAIIDGSFTCHMPDTLEMPYRPEVIGASSDFSEFEHSYRLGGVSCLAGDFLEAYSFPSVLRVGDQVIFKDMIQYTMVKTSMFNGVKHPSIGIWQEDIFELIKEFDYRAYKSRLS